MTRPEMIDDEALDRMGGGLSSDPEWRYVPVRRTATVSPTPGMTFLPEIDDEVIAG